MTTNPPNEPAGAAIVEVAEAPGIPPPMSAPAPTRRSRLAQTLLLLVALLVVAAGWLAVRSARLAQEQQALAAQLAQRDQALSDAAESARAAQRRIDALEQRVSGVEAGSTGAAVVAEIQSSRTEAVLIDVERLVLLADQQLQISGSVPAAITALSAAEGRLSRLNPPQFVELRRAIARDLDRLRAVPAVDATGAAIRLDELERAVDNWPFLADPKQRPVAAPPEPAPAKGKPAPPRDAAWYAAKVRGWLAQEFGDLVRIRELPPGTAAPVDPPAQQFVRERLRLRLLQARQALVARDERLYRADLSAAVELVERNLDVHQAAVAAALGQLRTLQSMQIAPETPRVDASLAALRNARTSAGLH